MSPLVSSAVSVAFLVLLHRAVSPLLLLLSFEFPTLSFVGFVFLIMSFVSPKFQLKLSHNYLNSTTYSYVQSDPLAS